MANLTRNFIAGRMNKVVDQRLVPNGEYIDAMNVRMGSTEKSEIGVIENSKGNTPLTALAYIDGTSLSVDATCIGAFADSANETLYWFVHDPNFTATASGPNPTGKLDLIVSFNTLTNILTYHIISIDDGSGLTTTLNFNPKYLITGINKIGKLLFFTEDYNQPRFINVTRNYADPLANIDGGGLPDLLRESILVIKKPPTQAPVPQLILQQGENNYLEERFICFAYRYRYIDGEYSATSQWSDPCFAPSEFSFSQNSYLNEGMTNAFNAAIVSYDTGGPLVVGIDLLFKQANSNIIKVIEKLDKSVLGIPDDTIQTFTFNNSKIFTVLPESEILRLYDNVPRLAKAQTIMGNRLMYGAYTEGYDLIDKFGSPLRLEYETQLLSEEIGLDNIPFSLATGNYTIDGSGVSIPNSTLEINLAGFDLVAGASITIDATILHNSYSGNTPYPTGASANFQVTFSFILPNSYPSVYDLATSVEFQNAIGTAFNIKPVYSPVPGADTSCDGSTFTDQVNCLAPNTLVTPNAFGSVTKIESGITGANEPVLIYVSSPSSNIISLQLIAMAYVDSLTSPSQTVYDYYKLTEVNTFYQKTASPRSLHSNRGYEIGIVYMDEFNRATTALVSPFNIEHVPCSDSVNKNSISVIIPTSQRAPAFAKRYKFVCKADTENYETIYTSIFFKNSLSGDVYFLLEGENTRKVQSGDRYIVKRDTSGPLLTCAYATVLEKEAKQQGFITTAEGVEPPAGVYMKMNPSSFQANQGANSIINPGQLVTNQDEPDLYPIQGYPMNIQVGGSWVDYTVPIGAIIHLEFKFQRLGYGDGTHNCERRIYTLDVTLTSSADYANMYDWWVGDNVAGVLNSGTAEVGDPEACPIQNVFIPTINPPSIPGDHTCQNYFLFVRNPDNQLLLVTTGTVRCRGYTQADKRRSSITSKVTVFRGSGLLVFETLPTETLPDIFFENELSFPIDDEGNHLSNGAPNDVSQDIAAGTPGIIQTGFFNCFAFGNAVESYKIRDSIIGRSFNLGNRVTSVAAQDYKAADRYADITYSGVYNQETNVNKLNEFNLGLLNFKNLETSFGRIFIIDGRDTDVLVLQEDKISYVLADKNLLSDSTGGGAIASVPEVLGTQIARTEKYGISFNAESYVHWGYDRFFTDTKRGVVIQLRGASGSGEDLNVISDMGMRTWFRDEFIQSFYTQKLGGYDPYMNEYVLGMNDIQLPGNPNCIACGVTQTFTLSGPIDTEKTIEYCVNLGPSIGESAITWTISTITSGTTFSVNVLYNGDNYSSGVTEDPGTIIFYKGSISEETAVITISYTGALVLNAIVDCPTPELLNVIEVVLTSDSNAGDTIHTQYRYTNGTFVGPLQSSAVVFQSSSIPPVVSRYNLITGSVGTGSFPPATSTVFIQTNRINPDNYIFDPGNDKFRYLRSNVLYENNAIDIAAMIDASDVATPITAAGNVFQSNFVMPSSAAGEYLYLIWDLRKSSVSNLCYTGDGSEESLKALCCECLPCLEQCISIGISNVSSRKPAEVYFPSGVCGESTPVTITIDPLESVTICVTNAPYQVLSGDVSLSLLECGCTCPCAQYQIYNVAGSTTLAYYDCEKGFQRVNLSPGNGLAFCADKTQDAPFVEGASATIAVTNPCGCSTVTCVTWNIVNNSSSSAYVMVRDCSTDEEDYITMTPGQSIQRCTSDGFPPQVLTGTLDITIANPLICI